MATRAASKRNGKAAGGRLSRIPEISRASPWREGPTLEPHYKGVPGGSGSLLLDALRLNLHGRDTVERPYEEIPPFHACNKEFSESAAAVPLQLWTADPRKDESAEMVSDDDPIALLLKRPNPYQSQYQLEIADSVIRKIDGESFWFLHGSRSPDDGTTVLGPWDPSSREPPVLFVSARGSIVEGEQDKATGLPRRWRYKISGGSESPWFPSESVVHFRNFDPENPLRGLGDADVLKRTFDLSFQADRYMSGVLHNGGAPDFAISYGDGINLGDAEMQAAQRKMDEQFANPENRGKPKILDMGATINRIGIPPKDMEFGEGQLWWLNMICSVTKVPPPLIGILENATYSNFEQAVRAFWTVGVIPYLRDRQDVLNTMFLPRMPGAEGYVAIYDLSEIEALAEDKVAALEGAQKLAVSGAGPNFNESAKLYDLDVEEQDEWSVRVRPATLTTEADRQAQTETAPAVTTEDMERIAQETIGKSVGVGGPLADIPAAVKFMLRRWYIDRYQKAFFVPMSAPMFQAVSKWLRQYEEAQIKAIRSFAERGYVKERELDGAETKQSDPTQLSEDVWSSVRLNEERWAEKLADATGPSYEGIWFRSLEDMATELSTQTVAITDPAVVHAMTDKAVLMSEGVASTNAKMVRESIVRVLAENPTSSNAQVAVQEVLPELTEELRRVFGTRAVRARTIADTETTGSANIARTQQMENDGIVNVEWLTIGDAVVRETHQELDGQVRPIGSDFKSNLRHPHDPRAPASEVVNCRCITRPGQEELDADAA